jgi:hypothetical protein
MSYRLRFWALACFLVISLTLPTAAVELGRVKASGDCTRYALTVSGADLDRSQVAVEFSIAITPTIGERSVLSDDFIIKRTPDKERFSATFSQLWAHYGLTLSGQYSLSGKATVQSKHSHYRPILFSPVTITCASQPTLSSLVIGPTDLNIGQQQQMVATAIYSDGSRATVMPQTWASANTQALTIGSSGLATGIAYGQSTVSASFSGVVGKAVVQVHGGALGITITGAVTGTVMITGAGGYSASVVGTSTLQVAPGNYTVAGNPTSSGNSTYWPTIPFQTVTVSDGGMASATVDYATIIPNTTKVLDGLGINGLVVSSDGSTITIPSSSVVATSLNVGDVLAIAPSIPAPSGLLLRILSVSASGTIITASVQRAALADAIQQATVQVTQVIGPQNLTAESRKMLVAPKSSAASTSTGACAGIANTIQLPYSIPILQGSSDVTLSGEDDLCATVQLSFQITDFTLESLNATLQGGLHTSIGLSDSVKGTINNLVTIPIFKGTPIPVTIGGIPIAVTPSIALFGGLSATAEVRVSTGVTTDTTLTTGLSYANGVWSQVASDISPTVVAATTSAGANTKLKGRAGVTLGLSVDTPIITTVGADVNLSGDGYVELNAGLNENPCWTVNGGLEANAAISARVFDETVASYTTPTANLYTKNLARAQGPCYTITVTPQSSSLGINQVVQLHASELDILGNPISNPFTWKTSDASIAAVDSTGQVTAVSAGTARISATDVLTTAIGLADITTGLAAPTYFLVGNWAGTATQVDDEGSSTSNIGISISQTATGFSATLTVLGDGDVPVTYTANGQVNGNKISFAIASNDLGDDNVDGGVTGAISTDGLQLTGSGLDGTSGSMTWDGKDTLTGSTTLVRDGGDTWSGTLVTTGQQLTGNASNGSSGTLSWTVTRQ